MEVFSNGFTEQGDERLQKKIKIIEDRKAFILAIGLLIFIWIFFSNYWHYRSPPIESLTAKEVIRIVEEEGSEREFMKIATENDFDWYVSKGAFYFGNNISNSLSDRGWHYQKSIPYYKPNGKLIRIEEIFTKNQLAGNLGTTLKLELYSWEEGILFLKIPKDIEFKND